MRDCSSSRRNVSPLSFVYRIHTTQGAAHENHRHHLRRGPVRHAPRHRDGAPVRPQHGPRFRPGAPGRCAGCPPGRRRRRARAARLAVAAAERALPAMAATSVAERIAMLRRLHEAVLAVADPLFDAVIQEYGAPVSRARWMVDYAAASFSNAIETLEQFSFSRQMGTAQVVYEPIGVAGLITPWNSNAGFICNKLAFALAAGCTAVIKPSEMSALQTRIVSEALHNAGLPPGVFNIVTGRGDTVGAEIVGHPAVRKISFTGSTAVGKAIARAGVDSLKRVTLELGGKSPFIVLDDADFNVAAPMALQAGFLNSGQACLAGTRILVPRQRLAEFETAL